MSEQTRSILAILSTDIPGYTQKTEEDESQAALDYLSGMTDHYAIHQAELLQPGISRGVFSRVPLA